jgi:threonine/homoserine/homoserine lactone efflux protein
MIIAATLLNATGICAAAYLAYMVVQAFRGGH